MNNISQFNYFLDLFVISIAAIPLYYSMKSCLWQRLFLSFIGFFLLSVIAPRLAAAFLGYWIIIWMVQSRIAGRGDEAGGTIKLIAGIAVALGPMLLWKIRPEAFIVMANLKMNALAWMVWRPLGEVDAVHRIVAPIGLSFAAFRACDMIVQSWLGLVPRLSFDRVLFFGFLPPVQVLGPIIEWSDVSGPPERYKFDYSLFSDGLLRIAEGLLKIFLLAWPLENATSLLVSPETFSIPAAWIYLFAYVWYFYLNFAGYSDLAIGLAMLYGMRIKNNFDNPLLQSNPQAFWSRWHISLTDFVRRNVFLALGGYRPERQYVAIAATLMVIALWHDVSKSLVLFAAYHTVGLVSHRLWSERARLRGHLPSRGSLAVAAKTLGTFVFVALSFPMLTLPFDALPGFYLKLIWG